MDRGLVPSQGKEAVSQSTADSRRRRKGEEEEDEKEEDEEEEVSCLIVFLLSVSLSTIYLSHSREDACARRLRFLFLTKFRHFRCYFLLRCLFLFISRFSSEPEVFTLLLYHLRACCLLQFINWVSIDHSLTQAVAYFLFLLTIRSDH
jgi:hypothetical protein